MRFKILTTIFIAMLLGLTLIPVSQVSAGSVIDVVFENTPLFNEANIVPGDSATRWVRVTNKVSESIAISTAAKGIDDPDGLGDMLNIVIKKGGTILYQNTLTNFFNATSVSLGSLAIGASAQYDYTIGFNTLAGNNYQEKTLMFDIDITGQTSSDIVENNNTVITNYYGGGGSSGGGVFLSYSQNTNNSTSNPGQTSVKGATAAPNLVISKNADSSFANPGDTKIPYHITITNNGNLTAYGVKLNDVLEAGMVFSDDQSNIKNWDLGDIGPGETKTIDYLADVAASAAGGKYKNTAAVSASNFDAVKTAVDLDVRPISVLGMELTPTGFSAKELIILLSAIALIIGSVLVIKKKYLA